MKKTLAAVAAVLMCAASAMADMTGTTMNISINHDQFTPLSALNNASYTYGDSTNYSVPGWGSLTISSPAVAPGMANAINIDFTNFAYSAFVAPFPANGTIVVHDLADSFDLSSIKVLVNGTDIGFGVAANGNGFQASWSAPLVFAGNPVQPNVTIAWNPVPAPGPLALLATAGVIVARRRRKS